MITAQEYIDAVELVKQYHKQIGTTLEKVRITTRDFAEKHRENLSTRLYIGIRRSHVDYIDELTFREIRRVSGIGTKLIAEYKKLLENTDIYES